MNPILITGATGNIGRAIFKYLEAPGDVVKAGVRNPAKTSFPRDDHVALVPAVWEGTEAYGYF